MVGLGEHDGARRIVAELEEVAQGVVVGGLREAQQLRLVDLAGVGDAALRVLRATGGEVLATASMNSGLFVRRMMSA